MLVGRLDDGRRYSLEQLYSLIKIGDCGDHKVVLLGVHASVVHTEVARKREGRSEYEDASGFLVHNHPVRAEDLFVPVEVPTSITFGRTRRQG